VVRAAHDLGLQVIALVGPVSLLLALASSGMNGQNFAFVGYLPQDAQDRTRRIKELEQLAHKTGQTQLFIETPYRNAPLWSSLVQTLQANTRLAFSSGITLPDAKHQSATMAQSHRSNAGWFEQPNACRVCHWQLKADAKPPG
jgi:16S rRNA (cytidine1402-2'-O)-methyltransferase